MKMINYDEAEIAIFECIKVFKKCNFNILNKVTAPKKNDLLIIFGKHIYNFLSEDNGVGVKVKKQIIMDELKIMDEKLSGYEKLGQYGNRYNSTYDETKKMLGVNGNDYNAFIRDIISPLMNGRTDKSTMDYIISHSAERNKETMKTIFPSLESLKTEKDFLLLAEHVMHLYSKKIINNSMTNVHIMSHITKQAMGKNKMDNAHNNEFLDNIKGVNIQKIKENQAKEVANETLRPR